MILVVELEKRNKWCYQVKGDYPSTGLGNWVALVIWNSFSLTIKQTQTANQGYLSLNIQLLAFKYKVGKPPKPCCV